MVETSSPIGANCPECKRMKQRASTAAAMHRQKAERLARLQGRTCSCGNPIPPTAQARRVRCFECRPAGRLEPEAARSYRNAKRLENRFEAMRLKWERGECGVYCPECCGQPHRREHSGCPVCGEAFEEQSRPEVTFSIGCSLAVFPSVMGESRG
jgi:hypothetical protein